ncbi:MAG: translation elongation factor Ts [Omnitrophica WOR_2 bacterium GWA2_47_8]|nr:MAG: translation elongation factor Ts [Omnitrophica WOR_2 bacterium GWA2_47_8]
MEISLDDIKELREATSCGVIDCKNALEEAKGDFKKAKELLQKKGLEMAAKKADRVAKEGRVEAYIHGGKIGVLVEVNCETDFVAKNEDFCAFTKNVAMHIAAMDPKYIKKDNVPAAVLAEAPNKDQFIKENCLMEQSYIKDQSQTIQDYLNSLIAKIGENIAVNRFIRFKVGEAK